MQLYCSVSEILDDLDKPGADEAKTLRNIRDASRFIAGLFEWPMLPEIATRSFRGGDGDTLFLRSPLLRVTSLTHLDEALTAGVDFSLEPQERWWTGGPYSRLATLPDGSIGGWADTAGAVEIAGWWGLYDEAISLQLSTVSQLIGASTIEVSDGSQVSPGMLLKLNDEWEEVTGAAPASASGATLNGAIDETDEEITLSDGSLVKTGEVIKINFERMRVLDIAGNDVAVKRAYALTRRASHLTAAAVYVQRSYTVSRGANGSTAAAHSSAAVYRQVPPGDVNYLCRQIAALMGIKAGTQFAGRQGTADGETFYYNEFPSAIEKIKDKYRFGV